MMTITFENTEADAVAWNVYRVFNTPLSRRVMTQYRVFSALSVSFILTLFAWVLTDETALQSFQALIVPATAILTFAAVYALRLRLEPSMIAGQTRKLVKRGDFNRFLGRKDVSISPGGLRVAFAEGESTLKWSAIKQWAETETHIIFFWSDNEIISVPKRAFADEAQRNEFLALADRYRQGQATPVAAGVGATDSPWWRSRHAVDAETQNLNRLGES